MKLSKIKMTWLKIQISFGLVLVEIFSSILVDKFRFFLTPIQILCLIKVAGLRMFP